MRSLPFVVGTVLVMLLNAIAVADPDLIPVIRLGSDRSSGECKLKECTCYDWVVKYRYNSSMGISHKSNEIYWGMNSYKTYERAERAVASARGGNVDSWYREPDGPFCEILDSGPGALEPGLYTTQQKTTIKRIANSWLQLTLPHYKDLTHKREDIFYYFTKAREAGNTMIRRGYGVYENPYENTGSVVYEYGHELTRAYDDVMKLRKLLSPFEQLTDNVARQIQSVTQDLEQTNADLSGMYKRFTPSQRAFVNGDIDEISSVEKPDANSGGGGTNGTAGHPLRPPQTIYTTAPEEYAPQRGSSSTNGAISTWTTVSPNGTSILHFKNNSSMRLRVSNVRLSACSGSCDQLSMPADFFIGAGVERAYPLGAANGATFSVDFDQ